MWFEDENGSVKHTRTRGSKWGYSFKRNVVFASTGKYFLRARSDNKNANIRITVFFNGDPVPKEASGDYAEAELQQ